MANLKVVIIGAGFGGLQAALGFKHSSIDVTVIDKNNFHLFQPLLYQVATAGLSPADIATPIRSTLSQYRNISVQMAEVTSIDTRAKQVHLKDRAENVPYDYLILATGSNYTYFGHDEWRTVSPSLKTINDATTIRRRILSAFEAAEMEANPEVRAELLRFVIVGGGPTGVELAGSLSELAHRAIASDFRHIDAKQTQIVLIEAGPRILASFPEKLSERAKQELIRKDVTVRTGARVEQIDAQGVLLGKERIASRTVIWAAGIVASPAGKWVGAATDKLGRVVVQTDLSVPGLPEVFAIGDTAAFTQNGKPLPGLAPVAIQMGKFVARTIISRARGDNRTNEFRYFDKGSLATIGRRFAIADVGRFQLSGLIAWITWAFVHILYLVGFRNRFFVLLEWRWSYLTYQRGARLITPPDSPDANKS